MSRTRTTGKLAVIALRAALLVAVAGCGGSGSSHTSDPFAWLNAASAPGGWKVVRIHGGAILAYPPGWTALKSDPGTATLALLGADKRIDAYLNATPRQGNETLANWSRFRVEHNREEGDRAVRLVAATNSARFRTGPGACVIDTYATSKANYHEIACLVSRPGSSAVVVAAAPTSLWDKKAATLERAVSSFVP